MREVRRAGLSLGVEAAMTLSNADTFPISSR